MFGLGWSELLVILLVLVLLFGASKLPQLGAGLGQGIKNFRKAFREIREEDEKLSPPQPAAPKPEASGEPESSRQSPRSDRAR